MVVVVWIVDRFLETIMGNVYYIVVVLNLRISPYQ